MISKIRPWLARAVIAVMLVWFFGGLAMFPDAPVHQCVSGRNYEYTNHPYGYCGKQGQSRTATDFARFEFWQGNMLWVWPTGMLTLFLLTKERSQNWFREAKRTSKPLE